MTAYIALLRGINVGGHNVVKMQDLRYMLESLGVHQVKTYIQSGNIVFQSDEKSERLKYKIEQEIKETFDFSISVMLRTAADWEAIINNCPYSTDAFGEGDNLHLALLETEPTEENIKFLLDFNSPTEECTIQKKEIYLLLHQKFSNSKLPNHIQKLDIPITIRNWKTVLKLNNMINDVHE